MIITKEIIIGICYLNLEHYKKLGYDVKIGDKILVPVEHLTPQSNIKVKVKCDVCGKEKEVKYQAYIWSIKKGGFYACSAKCAWSKNRETNLKKYGCESPSGWTEVCEKRRKTTKERYGVDNISQSDYFKEKYKEIMLERYGVENGFQSEEIKRKSRETSIDKYGCEFHQQNENQKKKYLYGNLNSAYIDGRSYEKDWFGNPLTKAFRRKIFSTRERKCICCGVEKRKMEIHHIWSRNTHPHLIYNEFNVVIMCKSCHSLFHKEYGYGTNDKNQFIDFLNNMSE